MSEEGLTESCFTCGRTFRMGPHAYEGKYIGSYEMTVCKICYDGNWDGWAPHLEEKIIKHIEKKGIATPQRNSKGLLPRE
jgi:hypothetical protein